jgi:hypothetical protein
LNARGAKVPFPAGAQWAHNDHDRIDERQVKSIMTIQAFLKGAAVLWLLAAAPALAQACPAADSTLWAAAAQACTKTQDSQACLGAGHVTPAARKGAPQFSFAAPGDTVEAAALQSVDLDANSAAVIHTPANLKQGQVTLALFGDVQLADTVKSKYIPPKPAVSGDTTFTMQAKTWFQGTPLNKTPDLIAYQPVATLDKDVTVTITGRTGDTSHDFVRVLTVDGIAGWTTPPMFKLPNGKSVDQSPDFLKLPLIDIQSATGARKSPFEQITFQGAPCPGSGLLISVPKGSGVVWFQINKHWLTLASTLFIYDTPDGGTVYATLEGTVVIYIQDKALLIPGGSQVTVASDGSIGPLAPNDPSALQLAALTLLPDGITADPPLTAAQIDAWANPSADAPIQGGSWLLMLFGWDVSGTCPYPSSIVNSLGDINEYFTWDGNVDDLIQYWKSGTAQGVAASGGVNFEFRQDGDDYIFTSVNGTTNTQVTFRRVSQSYFAVFSDLSSGADCLLSGYGLLYSP